MVAEEVIITLSGGAPWGFRLQGGVEHQKPLQVAKVRRLTQQVGQKQSFLGLLIGKKKTMLDSTAAVKRGETSDGIYQMEI